MSFYEEEQCLAGPHQSGISYSLIGTMFKLTCSSHEASLGERGMGRFPRSLKDYVLFMGDFKEVGPSIGFRYINSGSLGKSLLQADLPNL